MAQGKEVINPAVNGRLHLRLELVALFQLFQQDKNNLKKETKEFQALESLLRAVSKKTLIAYQKGYINQEDLKEIEKELSLIHQTLDQVQKIKVPALQKIKHLGMKVYTTCPLSALQIRLPKGPFPIEEAVEEELEERKPAVKPALSKDPTPISLSENKIKDMATVQKQVRALVETPSLHRVMETIYQTEFLPYQRNQKTVWFGLSESNFDPNPNSGWWTISENDAVQLMNDLNNLSKWLKDEIKKQNPVSIDCYEVLLKMSAIVLFLNSRFFKLNEYGSTTYEVIEAIKDFYNLSSFNMFGTVEYEIYDRTGHRLHALNVGTSKGLQDFAYAIETKKDQTLTREQGEQNFRYTYKQIELIKELKDTFKSFHPSQIQQWVRPLRHPFLLAAYRNVGIRIGEHIKSGGVSVFQKVFTSISKQKEKNIQNEHEAHLQHKCGMKTQEAIVDDPEIVADFLTDDMNEIVKYVDRFKKNKKELFVPIKQKFRQFTKEEMTAILLLTRKEYPQTELIAFIEAHGALLQEPEVCNFIDMLFFHSSLTETLNKFIEFRKQLPLFLDHKLKEWQQRMSTNPRFAMPFLFLVEFNEKVKSIYKEQQYDIKEFNSSGIAQVCEWSKPGAIPLEWQPHSAQIFTLSLKHLLGQQPLTQDQIVQIIVVYNFLKQSVGNVLQVDPQLTHWIETHYQDLCQELMRQPVLDESAFHFVLDALCEHTRLPLDLSSWQGTFPVFKNNQYQIDLKTGKITTIKNNLNAGALPGNVVLDPLFQRVFNHLNVHELSVTYKEDQQGFKTYFFKDSQGSHCRIEEERGIIVFIKHLLISKTKNYRLLPLQTCKKLPRTRKIRGLMPRRLLLCLICLITIFI